MSDKIRFRKNQQNSFERLQFGAVRKDIPKQDFSLTRTALSAPVVEQLLFGEVRLESDTFLNVLSRLCGFSCSFLDLRCINGHIADPAWCASLESSQSFGVQLNRLNIVRLPWRLKHAYTVHIVRQRAKNGVIVQKTVLRTTISKRSHSPTRRQKKSQNINSSKKICRRTWKQSIGTGDFGRKFLFD